jgi:aryl-alcohol dehydrogenase-like predicted oxidoreductase
MFTRTLGKSGIKVSAMGLGCWAIGGPWTLGGRQVGWGKINDDETIRAIHKALDMGVNFFDTAANYGAGHSERILGRAIAGRRDRVVIATKFGYVIDGENKAVVRDDDAVLGNIRQDCENSLRRLNTDYIDLYQFHVGIFPAEEAHKVRDVLEELVTEEKIRAYGWSTDHIDRARVFAEGEHCATVLHTLNVLTDASEMLALCQEFALGSINKYPLLMGVLTGKFSADTTFPEDDVRHGWDFKTEPRATWLAQLKAVREVLTQGGRTLAQGALGWIWARGEHTIPIPGFKTVAQVAENIKALEFGPLNDEQMRQIDEILGREPIAGR